MQKYSSVECGLPFIHILSFPSDLLEYAVLSQTTSISTLDYIKNLSKLFSKLSDWSAQRLFSLRTK